MQELTFSSSHFVVLSGGKEKADYSYHAGVLCFSPDLLGRPPEYRLRFD